MRDALLIEEAQQLLDDRLSRWFWLRKSCKVARGYADRALVFGELYRPSRQRDDENGKLDADLEEFQARGVDAAVAIMVDPWRTAIHFEARNLYFGHSVWISPRLPADKFARQVIVAEARRQAINLLGLDA